MKFISRQQMNLKFLKLSCDIGSWKIVCSYWIFTFLVEAYDLEGHKLKPVDNNNKIFQV